MYLKNEKIKRLYRVIFLLVCMTGIVLQYAIIKDKTGLLMLGCYYTIQSNMICLLYFAYLVIMSPKKENSLIKSALVLYIAITGLVYHFMLNGLMETNVESIREITNADILANLCVHYFSPLMVIFDYLLFSPKGEYKWYYPFAWLIIPCAYAIFIFIRAEVSSNMFKGFNSTLSRYPYPFIDVDIYGWGKVILMVILILIGVLALGYIAYGVDKLLKLIKTKYDERKIKNLI